RSVHAAENDGYIGAYAVGDPDFLAIQDVVIAVLPGSGFHAGDIGTRLRLGQGIAAYPLATGKQGQVVTLLYLCSRVLNAQGDKTGMHGQKTTHRGVNATQFF